LKRTSISVPAGTNDDPGFGNKYSMSFENVILDKQKSKIIKYLRKYRVRFSIGIP
jgi:hypothetical protein